MIVSSTEVQNNFGKYLMLAAKEDVIITRNGMVIAKLTAVEDDAAGEEKVSENLTKYGWYGGRKATYEEFLELTRHSEDRYEYIDGEIYYLASPKPYQVVLTELLVIFITGSRGKSAGRW